MPRHKIHRVTGIPGAFKTRCGKSAGTMRDSASGALVPDGQMLSVRLDAEMPKVHPDYRCGRCERSWDSETQAILRDVAATPPPPVR